MLFRGPVLHLRRRERVSVLQRQGACDGNGLCHVDDAHLWSAAAHMVDVKTAADMAMVCNGGVALPYPMSWPGTDILLQLCQITAHTSAPALQDLACRQWSRPGGRRCRRRSQAGPLAPGQRSGMRLSSSTGTSAAHGLHRLVWVCSVLGAWYSSRWPPDQVDPAKRMQSRQASRQMSD